MAATTPQKTAAAKRPASAAPKKRSSPVRAKADKPGAAASEPLTVAVPLDTSDKVAWFANTKSKNEKLQTLKCSEADLIKKASKVSGLTSEAIARSGMQAYAKRLLSNASNADPAGGQGVAGANDELFRQAYADLKKEPEKDITPSRLAYRAAKISGRRKLEKGGFRSANRWLQIHHPESAA